MAVTFNYAKAQATADRLVAKFGRTMTLKRRVPGSTGPAHRPTGTTWIEYSVKAAALPASKGTIEAFDNRVETRSLVLEKLRYVIMAPTMVRTSPEGPETIVPDANDVLTFDGLDWIVLGCTPLAPAGVPVYFPMGVKLSGPTAAP